MLKTLQTTGQVLRGARALGTSPVTISSGRGGRSSTNSHTVTVFGATGRMGRYLVNSLGQQGTQIILPHRCDVHTVQYLKVSYSEAKEPAFTRLAILAQSLKLSIYFKGVLRGNNTFFPQLSSDLGQQHPVYTPDFNDEAHLEEVVKYSDVVVNLTGKVYADDFLV